MIADGALGFWKAAGEVWPKAREQRCWVHKTANVLNKLPKSQQPKAKRMLQEIWMAETNRSRTHIEIGEAWEFGTFGFDPDLVSLLRSTAAGLGVMTMDIKSQAGHDAYNVAKVAPTCMIFTPCYGGISHNVKENTTLDDQLPGVNVLLNSVVDRANR